MKDTRKDCEYIRHQAKTNFDKVRTSWCDLLRWGLPHRASWILSQTEGERKNQHIVDPTHILALRQTVAGFLEGNTSSTRPWARIGTRDSERNENSDNKAWLQHFTERVMSYLSASNFYHAAGNFYYDYHVVNTGAHYFEEKPQGGFYVHTLIPGAYYVVNDSRNEAVILIREFTMNVKSIVDTYGKNDDNGKADWSNISENVKKMYNDGNYTQLVDVVHIVKENPEYDVENPEDPFQKQWLELTYEAGSSNGTANNQGNGHIEDSGRNKFLKRHTTKRKPFVVGKSTEGFEYGEKGATSDALGLIKSLNKKAIGKDQALEKILSPALQGPASLRKSYVSHAPNTFVPLDSRSLGKQKLEPIFQISPVIGAIIQDVGEMRIMVDKLYYVDSLQFLSSNPKTRTATETNAVVDEQQRFLGPSLQSLNFTYNTPILEWVMDYVLFEDPFLRTPPEGLRGQSLSPEYISIFAQAQRAADLPAIDRYAAMVANVAQFDPKILSKINTDKLADLYEDRLYLPAGLNNDQDKVDAQREQAAQAAQRERQLQETIPAMAKAAKDASAAQK